MFSTPSLGSSSKGQRYVTIKTVPVFVRADNSPAYTSRTQVRSSVDATDNSLYISPFQGRSPTSSTPLPPHSFFVPFPLLFSLCLPAWGDRWCNVPGFVPVGPDHTNSDSSPTDPFQFVQLHGQMGLSLPRPKGQSTDRAARDMAVHRPLPRLWNKTRDTREPAMARRSVDILKPLSNTSSQLRGMYSQVAFAQSQSLK